MQPTPSDVHVNKPLSNISVAFMQSAEDFVADRVFPNIPVSFQSDVYYEFDRGFWNRAQMQRRAPSSESAGSGYEVNADNAYRCDIWALHKDIDDRVRANADVPLGPDREATEWLSLQALLRREKLWASEFFASGVWTNDYAGVSSSPSGSQVLQWNDAASTPIEDISDAKDIVKESTGFDPNKLVLGRQVYTKLKNHPDVIDRIKHSGHDAGRPAVANRRTMAALFEVDEVLVMAGIENTADEGATNSHSFIGGKKAGLFYAPPRPGLMTPSAGYTFSWTGLLGNSALGGRTMKFRMDQLKSDRVEMEMALDQKLVSADLGFFWDTVVA